MSELLHLGASAAPQRSVLAASLFAGLPESARVALIAASRLRQFDDEQLVQQRGDDGGGFWLVEAGQVRVGQFDAAGSFNAVALLGPGDSFGELALLAGRRRVVDAVASGTAQLRFIPVGALNRLMAKDSAVAAALVAALARQFHETLDLLMAFRRTAGAARLARTLAILVQDRALPVRLRISQQELADLIGTSRMTVSTALAEMERQGQVQRGYGWIEVHDLPGFPHRP